MCQQVNDQTRPTLGSLIVTQYTGHRNALLKRTKWFIRTKHLLGLTFQRYALYIFTRLLRKYVKHEYKNVVYVFFVCFVLPDKLWSPTRSRVCAMAMRTCALQVAPQQTEGLAASRRKDRPVSRHVSVFPQTRGNCNALLRSQLCTQSQENETAGG